MDVKRFQQELSELVKRHGGQLVEPVEVINASAPYQEFYTHPVPEMRGLHMFGAVREVQPVQLKISIEMDAEGAWRHSINYTPVTPDIFEDQRCAWFWT